MEPAWLEPLLAWIREHPGLAGLAIAFVAFAEGVAFVGVLIPGILILFGVGALVGVGAISMPMAWGWTAAGAILADSLGYWLGYRYRASIRDLWPFSRYR